MALQYEELVKSQSGQMTASAPAPVAPSTQPTGLRFDDIKAAQMAPPNPATPVPSADLGTNTSFPAAGAAPAPTPFVGSLNDSLKYFQDLYNKQTAEVEAAKKERESLKTILGEGYDKLNTYGDVYKQSESQMGIPKMYEDLNKLNLQLADLSGMYDKEFARVETKGIQDGTAGVFYQGEQAAIQRQKAVEIGALGIRQAAMVGNLELAQQRLEKTVELQFKPIENRIKQTLDFINMNYQDMSAAEQRQANTLQNTLAFQAQQLQQQKEDRSNALMAGVSSKFFKYPGSDQVYDTTTGEAVTYDQYLAKGGKTDFSSVTEFNPMETQQVLQLASQYPDAGILPSDSMAKATAKLRNSRIYQEKVRPPQGSGGGSSSGLNSLSIVDRNIDSQVKGVIQANIGGGYGNAYEAVKKQFGEQVANAYDKVYQSVFNNGASVDAAFNDAKIIMANTPTPEEQKKIEEQKRAQAMGMSLAKSNIDEVDKVLAGDRYFNNAVGKNYLARYTLKGQGSKSATIGSVEQIRSQLTLKALQDAKANGATFGALSDGEMRVLEASATKLGEWAIKKDGKVTGYEVDPKTFRIELEKISNFAKVDYVRKGGDPEEVGLKIMPDGKIFIRNSSGGYTEFNELQ